MTYNLLEIEILGRFDEWLLCKTVCMKQKYKYVSFKVGNEIVCGFNSCNYVTVNSHFRCQEMWQFWVI